MVSLFDCLSTSWHVYVTTVIKKFPELAEKEMEMRFVIRDCANDTKGNIGLAILRNTKADKKLFIMALKDIITDNNFSDKVKLTQEEFSDIASKGLKVAGL